MESVNRLASFELAGQANIVDVPGAPVLRIHTAVAGPDGSLYCSDEFNHRIVVTDADGRVTNTFGKQGHGVGEFWYPRGLAIVENEGESILVVCDAWNHRIQKFRLDGSCVGAFGSIGKGEDEFDEPVAVVPAGDGRIWVLDRCNHRIKLLSPDGKTLHIFGRFLTLDDEARENDPVNDLFGEEGASARVCGFNYPQAMAVGEDGDLLIADTNNNRICQVSADGALRRSVNLKENESPYFYPESVAALGGSLALVGGIASPFVVLDLKRPWVSEPAGLEMSDPSTPPAALLKSGDGEKVVLVDAAGGRISVYAVKPSPAGESAPPPFPIELKAGEVHDEWTEMAGESWFEYLMRATSDESGVERTRGFFDTCQGQALTAARELAKTEEGFLKTLTEYYEARERLRRSKAGGLFQAENDHEIVWKIMNLRQSQTRRNKLRRALVQNLAWLTAVLRQRSAGQKDDVLSEKGDKLKRMLDEEYSLRRKDYEDVRSWLFDSLKNVSTLNLAAAVHALAGLVFLDGHLAYLARTLRAFPEGKGTGRESEHLPRSLDYYKSEVILLADNLPLALGGLCMDFGLNDSAIILLRHGAQTYTKGSALYLERLAGAYQSMGDYQSALSVIDEIIGKFGENPSVRRARGSALKSLGRSDEALAEYERSVELGVSDETEFMIAGMSIVAGKFKEAEERYRAISARGEKGNPLYERSTLACCTALVLQNRLDEAYEFISSRPLAKSRQQAEIRKAEIFLMKGDFPRAASLLEPLAGENAQDEIKLRLAVILALAGERERASEMYDKVPADEKGPWNVFLKTVYMNVTDDSGEALKILSDIDEGMFVSTPPLTVQGVVAAKAMADNGAMDRYVKLALSATEKTGFWYSFIFAADSQAEQVEGALKDLRNRMESAGKNFHWERRTPAAWWYTAGNA